MTGKAQTSREGGASCITARGELLGLRKGMLPPRVADPCWGPSHPCWGPSPPLLGSLPPSLGSIPTLTGVPPHGAELHHGGPAPAQPLLDGQLQWGHTVLSRPRYESYGSPREFPQSSPTSSSTRHHSTRTRTCYRGTPGREGDTHMPEQAPLPALSQPGRRESGERGRHGRGETR